jgi:uncharacterized membrane protein YeaQ/YmgE (transglycosylase-associated protein family)
MELITFIVVGCSIALISRLLVPPRNMGLIRRLLVGMVGGIFGGTLGGTFNTQQELFAVATPSLLGASLGTLAVIATVTILNRRQAYA